MKSKIDKVFSRSYITLAKKVFTAPDPRYEWDEIVAGIEVGSKCHSAVGISTFRGFHRINKASHGAKNVFVNYFLDNKTELVGNLLRIRSRSELHKLSNRICKRIKDKLRNIIRSDQLDSYNKIRKPIDLYVEYLSSMARELDKVRSKLTPLLFLPLDSQIISDKALFSDDELGDHGLSRKSTYKDVTSESAYRALQGLVRRKSEAMSAHSRFYPIYFDLLWNKRYRNNGRNLFKINT